MKNNRQVPEPNYHCPVCETLSTMIISEIQAFCTNRDGCNVITFNPSLPDRGLSEMQIVDWKDLAKE